MIESYEHYVLQIKDLEVRIPIVRVDAETINIPIPKPLGKHLFFSGGQYTMNISQAEFFVDIQLQIPETLDGKFILVAFDSLYTVVLHHLRLNGRLLPRDLDVYVAENILLFSAIREATTYESFSSAEKEKVFSTLYEKIVGLLPSELQQNFGI